MVVKDLRRNSFIKTLYVYVHEEFNHNDPQKRVFWFDSKRHSRPELLFTVNVANTRLYQLSLRMLTTEYLFS